MLSRSVLVLPLLLLLAGAVYWVGLDGPFLLDDYNVILRTPATAMRELDLESLMAALYSADASYPQRGLSRLSLALDHYLAGGSFDPRVYKTTNLVIHLVNGLLVYVLAAMLLRRYAAVAPRPSAGWSVLSAPVALVACALWLLHPLQVSTVLYAVQRMTSLAALFVFAGVALFVHGRTRLEHGRSDGLGWMAAGVIGGTVLGALCKQNAVLLPFLAYLVELFFFTPRWLSARLRARLRLFQLLSVWLPLIAGVAVLAYSWPALVADYVHRDFDMGQRVLTQARVLFFYLLIMLVPNIRWYGLHHDDMVVSSGWLEPWTTLPAVAGWLVLGVLALIGLRRRSLWSFGLLWFLVAHAVESTFISLELVYEHRNYLPSFGPALAAAVYLLRALDGLRTGAAIRLGVPLLVVATLAFVTHSWAGIWSDRHELFGHGVRWHPESSRYQADFALELERRRAPPAQVYPHWRAAAAMRRNDTVTLLQMVRAIHDAFPELRVPPPGPAEHSPEAVEAGFPESADRAVPLLRALDREIRYRLSTLPFRWSTLELSLSSQRCTALERPTCVKMLAQVIGWLEVAVGNPLIPDVASAQLHNGLGRLYLIAGDAAAARRHLHDAIALAPRHVMHLVDYAELHLALGELDEAARVLEQARGRFGASATARPALRALAGKLAQARELAR